MLTVVHYTMLRGCMCPDHRYILLVFSYLNGLQGLIWMTWSSVPGPATGAVLFSLRADLRRPIPALSCLPGATRCRALASLSCCAKPLGVIPTHTGITRLIEVPFDCSTLRPLCHQQCLHPHVFIVPNITCLVSCGFPNG